MKRIALAFALATAFSVQAAEFTQVQADKSAINFTYKQMGVAVDGKFKRFSSQLTFDPAKPAAAKASFDVELASVDTGARKATRWPASPGSTPRPSRRQSLSRPASRPSAATSTK
jgi:polyisoprenoid-binding protein YceI